MKDKDKLLSFRTTEQNKEYITKLAESDERSISYVLNKMVDSFRARNIRKVPNIK